MTTGTHDSSVRSSYRHGDLRRALIEAGVTLAREGGPAAVVLREATRRAGVTPNAAYRHFADRQALLDAVCSSCQALVANTMEADQAAITTSDPVEAARLRFRAVGTGYLRFALDEPGQFQTAFSAASDLDSATSSARAGHGGLTPFQLLTQALDDLVTEGLLAPERRPAAEFLAWSAVHGLAELFIDGPLRALPAPVKQSLIVRVIDMVEKGL
jgi:AcrR family transcriptional regulator